MTFRILERFIAAGILFAICATAAGAWPYKQERKARIGFLAESDLIRRTWGSNVDTHLAQLTFTSFRNG